MFLFTVCICWVLCTSESMYCEHGGVPTGVVPDCSCDCVDGYDGDHCGIHPRNSPKTYNFCHKNKNMLV